MLWLSRDQAILRSLETMLAQDPVLSQFGIRALVEDGVATLFGMVDTIEQRDRAEGEAYAAGARYVKDLLNVRFPVNLPP